MLRTFDYKSGFLQAVDWRPREFNSAADLVADHVLDKKTDVQNLDVLDHDDIASSYAALQIFSDGGFDGKRFGSMAFVIIGYKMLAGRWQRRMLGYCGVLVD